MWRLCLSIAVVVCAAVPVWGISGNNCTVNVNGSVGNALTAPSSCATISVFVNPDINFAGGTPMPAGLLITKSSGSGGNATWQVSGTPTEAGVGTGIYTFTDSNPGAVTMTVNFNILGPVVVSGTFPAGTVGRAYTRTATASGGTGSGYAFNVSAGSLPPGLTLSGAGTLTGTPTAAGTYNFTVRAVDGGGNQGSLPVTLTVNAAVGVTSPVGLNRTVGQSYVGGITASGGTAPLVYSLSAGALPGGMVLNSGTGGFSGTVSGPGTGSFTVTVTDANGSNGAVVVNWEVSVAPGITLATPNGAVGTPYSQAIQFTGALTAATVSGGSLPPGLGLTSGGTVVSGTPTMPGSYAFTLAGTDSNGVGTAANFTIVVTAPLALTAGSLPGGTVGSAYSAALTATGGAGSYSYAVTGGALPPGLSLSSGGVLSGTPAAAGTFAFTVTVTDGHGGTAVGSFGLTVVAPPVVFNGGALPNATVGLAYAATLAGSGGAGPLSYVVTGGALPPGLTLASGGSLTGTPGAAGSYSFTVQASDGQGGSASGVFALVVVSPVTITGGGALPGGTVGAAYSYSFGLIGGTPPFVWSLSGTLPPGLVFAGGVVSGTPGVAGEVSVTVGVTDAVGATATAAASWTVNERLQITTANLGGPYSRESAVRVQLVASGGALPLVWSLASGPLPPGVMLLPGGELRGSTMEAGSFPVRLRVIDAAGAVAERGYLIGVGPGPQFASLELRGATLGAPYRQRLEVVSLLGLRNWRVGTFPETFPPGLRLEEGEIVGVPTRLGVYDFELNVEDEAGKATTGRFQLRVNEVLELPEMGPGELAVGRMAAWKPERRGGTGPWVWSLLAGRLPAGTQLNPQTGEVSGMVRSSGESRFTLEVSDANGAKARRLYVLRTGAVEPLSLRLTGVTSEARVGQEASGRLEPAGGVAPYEYRASGLPAGVRLVGGELTGQFRETGAWRAVFEVVDARGESAVAEWRGEVRPEGSVELSVAPRQLFFETTEGMRLGLPHTIRLGGQGKVRVRGREPWLRVTPAEVELPGTAEVRVDAGLLRPGSFRGQIEVGDETVIEVKVEHRAQDAGGWFLELAPGNNGGAVALVRAQGERVPLRASLSPDSAGHYLLHPTLAEASAPDSTAFWVERRETGGAAALTLRVRNEQSGEEREMAREGVAPTPWEVSAARLELLEGRRMPLVVRGQGPGSQSVAALGEAAWLQVRPVGTPSAGRMLFLIWAEGGTPGEESWVRFYDATGREALKVAVRKAGAKAGGIATHTQALTLGASRPAGQILLRNEGERKERFRLRGEAGLRVNPAAGEIDPGKEQTIEVEAAAPPGGGWSRRQIWLETAAERVSVIEVDWAVAEERNRCRLAAPIVAVEAPGRSASLLAGGSVAVVASVSNPCGQAIRAGQMWLRPKGEPAVMLMAGPDGRWYGAWTPQRTGAAAHAELLWLDPVEGVQASRWLSVEVKP